ncbi:hypothetical protein V5799_020439 [Amblyomma americanum]|uniref:C2H2-type domain-containing protein n=1 Tax=Amblyomma americanum TaxID=6943 RepID=A0AAQ4EUQ7_AMBAM
MRVMLEQQGSKHDQEVPAMENSSDHELLQLQKQLHEIRTQLAKSRCKAGGSARDDAVAKLDEVCKLLQHEEQLDDHCAAPVGNTEVCLNDPCAAHVDETEEHLDDRFSAPVGQTVPTNDAFTMTDCIAQSVAGPGSSSQSEHARVCPVVSSNEVKAVVVASSEAIVPTPSVLENSPPPPVVVDNQCPDVACETVLTSAGPTTSAHDHLSLAEADERNSESGASGSNEDHCYAAADASTSSVVPPNVKPAPCALETTTVWRAEKRPAETPHMLSKKRKVAPLDPSEQYIIMTERSGQPVFAQRRIVRVSNSASSVSSSDMSDLSVLKGDTSQPLPHQSMVTLLVKDDSGALLQSATTPGSLESGSPGTQKIFLQMRVLPPRAMASLASKQKTQTTGCQTDRVIVRRPRKAREPSPPQRPCTAIMKTLTTPVRRSQRRKKSKEDDVVQCVVFCCEECGDCFSAAKHLHRHWQNRHKEKPEGKHRCSYCSYTSDRKCHVAMHERTHTGERPFSCEVCKKGFYRADDVETHMRVHTKEKPFACDECGQRFNVSSNLTRHKKLHSDDPETHACPQCGKAFAQKVHLKAHLRVHTGDRPYSCSMCSQRFTELGSARKHEKMVHAGEYPHYCPHCGKGLANNFKLKKHLRARHYELTRAALAAAEEEQEG